jgi:phosphatidate cytidylyltransferase
LSALLARNPWWFGGLLGLTLAGGAWEWPALAGQRGIAARISYVCVALLLATLLRGVSWSAPDFQRLLLLSLGFWGAALLWLWLAPQRVARPAVLLAGLLVLVPACLALLRVAGEWRNGVRWTLLILALPVAMDTGGYFAGKAFGRCKLAPQVSPGKTWEGVLGGVVLVLLLAWITRSWAAVPLPLYLALCAGVAAWSVVGDLTESMFKRAAGLKDSGHLIPGHGGVLDRIDSITAAAPIMTLGLIWLGVGT